MALTMIVDGVEVSVGMKDRGMCQCKDPQFKYLEEHGIFECQDEECMETAEATFSVNGEVYSTAEAASKAATSKRKETRKGVIVPDQYGGKGLREMKADLTDLAARAHDAGKNYVMLVFDSGELLTAIKKRTKHGEFETIVKQACPFGMRTAQQYMKVYRLWKESKSACAALFSLSDALKGPEKLNAPKESDKNGKPKGGKASGEKTSDGSDLLENQPVESSKDVEKLVARLSNSNDGLRQKAVAELATVDPGVALKKSLESSKIECELKPKHAKALAKVASTLDQAKMVSVVVQMLDSLSAESKAKIVQRIFSGKKSEMPEELLRELSKRANLYLPKLGRARKDIPDSLDEVMTEAKRLVETGERSDATKYAKKFWHHFNSNQWMIKDGVPVQDWRSRLIVFCSMVGGETAEDRRVDVPATKSTSSIAERRKQIAEKKKQREAAAV